MFVWDNEQDSFTCFKNYFGLFIRLILLFLSMQGDRSCVSWPVALLHASLANVKKMALVNYIQPHEMNDPPPPKKKNKQKKQQKKTTTTTTTTNKREWPGNTTISDCRLTQGTARILLHCSRNYLGLFIRSILLILSMQGTDHVCCNLKPCVS